ncbi:MAG: STAS domain-containing protein [Anaerolineae bacterium]|nr:STAS domain-containing protein [Anaerolineae bacterium]
MTSAERAIAWLCQWITPQAEDDETALCERVVYALVLPTMFVVTILVVVGLVSWLGKRDGPSTWIGELILLVCLGSIYVVSRQGRVWLGGLLLVGLDLFTATYLILRQGYQSVNALFLLAAVVWAVLLLGIRTGVVAAILSSVLYALVVAAQDRGWLVPEAVLSPLESVFSLVLGICLLFGALTIFYRSHQAQRRHTRAMREQKDALVLADQEKDRLLSDLGTRLEQQKALLARFEIEDQAQSLLVSRLRQIFSPVIPVLNQVVVMPVVGELTTEQMEAFTTSLLAGVERHNARLALLDMTGVPQISEDVADKLVQAVDAIALLGAECVLVGIRPEVAHSIINLNIDLSQVVSLRDLQSGIEYALGRTGRRIVAAG